MLDLFLLTKIQSLDLSITQDEVEQALSEMESDSEAGGIDLLDSFINLHTIMTTKHGSMINALLHETNQTYIINSQDNPKVSNYQLAYLYFRNVEYYYSINAFAECAKYATMILDLNDIDELIRLYALSHMIVLLKNPALTEEGEPYFELFRELAANSNLAPESRLLIYMGLLDDVCISRDKSGYIRYKDIANALLPYVKDEQIIKRYEYRLLICDALLVTRSFTSTLLKQLSEIARFVSQNNNVFDTISDITVEICKKLEATVSYEKIASFIAELISKAPTNLDRLTFLKYLIDDLKIPRERYAAYYDMYFNELRTYRYNIERNSILELKNEIILYKRNKIKETKSHIDDLTGLFNRNTYEEMMENYPEVLEDNLSVIMGDVNFLKVINDTYGHKSGDELLANLGKIFLNAISPYGKAYRVGGDEFIGIVYLDDPQAIINNLNLVIEKTVGPNGVPYSISFGLASAKNLAGLSLSELIHLADQRMYKEKEKVHKRKFLNPIA